MHGGVGKLVENLQQNKTPFRGRVESQGEMIT